MRWYYLVDDYRDWFKTNSKSLVPHRKRDLIIAKMPVRAKTRKGCWI